MRGGKRSYCSSACRGSICPLLPRDWQLDIVFFHVRAIVTGIVWVLKPATMCIMISACAFCTEKKSVHSALPVQLFEQPFSPPPPPLPSAHPPSPPPTPVCSLLEPLSNTLLSTARKLRTAHSNEEDRSIGNKQKKRNDQDAYHTPFSSLLGSPSHSSDTSLGGKLGQM